MLYVMFFVVMSCSMVLGTNTLEKPAAFTFKVEVLWFLSSTLHGITAQETITSLFTAMRTLNLIYIKI